MTPTSPVSLIIIDPAACRCFSNCMLQLNGFSVESYSNKNFPYAAYLKTLLLTSANYKRDVSLISSQ